MPDSCRPPGQSPFPEICDGYDNNCAGGADEGDPDGGLPCTISANKGICRAGTTHCIGGAIVCTQNNQPAAQETCDGLDNDCDGSTDEQGSADLPKMTQSCYDGPVGTENVGECRGGQRACDAAPDAGSAHWTECGVCGSLATCTSQVKPANPPAQPEISCNNKDDDCDGTKDDGNPDGGQACVTGQPGVCSAGTTQCIAGSLPCIQNTLASAEQCDGLDNDCDGLTDEQAANPSQKLVTACYDGPTGTMDAGICHAGEKACDAAADAGSPHWTTCGVCGGLASCASQVLPANPPAQPETSCNNQDDDCDGTKDDGNPQGGGTCNTGQPGVCSAGTFTCINGALPCKSNVDAGPEVCDGLDNDCDTFTDEQAGNSSQKLTARCYTGPTYSVDAGVCRFGEMACSATVGSGSPSWTNCSDCGSLATCATQVLPQLLQDGGTPRYDGGIGDPEFQCDGFDNDCDGRPDDGLTVDNDGDGRRACGTCGAPPDGGCDCKDDAGQIYPGRFEACNGIDDDCDLFTDENVTRICYAGIDAGYPASYTGTCPNVPGVNSCAPRGLCRGVLQLCTGGAFPVCDVTSTAPDGGVQVFPQLEECNNLDDNCNGQRDEGLGGGGCTSGMAGECSAGTYQCRDAGSGVFQLICVPDAGPTIELCDGKDNDCNGTTDVLADGGAITRSCFDGDAGTFTGVCPGPTCTPRGECRAGFQACQEGGPGVYGACLNQTLPVPEVCNGKDDNCMNGNDEGLQVDVDKDTYYKCGTCLPVGVTVCDCDDNDARVRPGVAEVCNAVDDNCNGSTDEGSGPGGKYAASCYTGPGGTAGIGQCLSGTAVCNATVPWVASYGTCTNEKTPKEEVCNGLDDDCNGKPDDGFDKDNDGFLDCTACNNSLNCDCNDNDRNIKPGAVELCDDVDQNCNGRLDDVPPRKCFFGPLVTPETYTGTCPGPTCSPKGACVAGLQQCSTQGAWGTCSNVVLPASDPSGPELVCDGKDDDCDGTIDDGTFDEDKDTWKSCENDCNDKDPAIHPGALEMCDGKDNDCDGTTDGMNTGCYSGPANTRMLGLCKDGTQSCSNGVGSGPCVGEVTPRLLSDGGVPEFVDGGVNSPEVLCDGKDEDCDGIIDDGFDLDGDGVTSCAGDCDDTDPFNAPGLVERCDCHDNNCDGKIDEGEACKGAPCHDFDFDGYTNCQGDCDDSSSAVNPRVSERVGNGRDDDCDGIVDEDTDEDGDGYSTAQGDCDDRFRAISPGSIEVCDGFDNNCDGKVDEGFDKDNDSVTSCAGDCDDADFSRSPFRPEICGNGKDDNCDGRVDEELDRDADGVTTCQGDCNDFNAAVHPAAPGIAAAEEICDGQDNDCDGQTDEGFDEDIPHGDGVATCFGDCAPLDPEVNPNHWEVPGNGIDDNCDGHIDEGTEDLDNDGFSGNCGDCNDGDRDINPHAKEICDRVDNNCDGYIDSARGRYDLCAVCFDADDDKQTNCDGDCNDADKTIYRGAPELCDGKDNDCDGDTDLDPATGLKVCKADGGIDDGGIDGGIDDGGVDGGVDAGVEGPSDGGPIVPERSSVRVGGCNCASSADLAPLAFLALALGAWRSRRSSGLRSRRSASARLAGAVLVLPLASALLTLGCSTELSTPRPLSHDADSGDDAGVEPVDGGPGDGGVDDGGFEPPVSNWPCPGLAPVEMVGTTIPGTLNSFAHSRRYKVTPHEPAQFLLLDDGPADIAAFVVRRPVPPDVSPTDATALDTIGSREVNALTSLAGSPAVRDRLERFSRILTGDLATKNFSHGEQMVFASGTTAFAVRNRLLAALAGRPVAELGTLPVFPNAKVGETMVVYVFLRLTQTDLFVGAAVTPQTRFVENLPALGDLTNGSHLSGVNASIEYGCEDRKAPALKTDFLFVVDNSFSMLEEQTALANAGAGLFEAFQRSGLDFRVGTVTTDSDVLRGEGFTSSLDQFKSDVRVGVSGNGLEMGIEYGLRAVRRAKNPALEQPFKIRQDAGLVVVFVSDEENTGLISIAEYAKAFNAEKAVAFAIVGPRPSGCTRVGLSNAKAGTQYVELAARTGGSTGSICNPNITEVIEEILFGAIGASSRSPLENRPISGSLAVLTDKVVPRARLNGFDYDSATNTVLFFGNVPAEGTGFKSAYAYFYYPK